MLYLHCPAIVFYHLQFHQKRHQQKKLLQKVHIFCIYYNYKYLSIIFKASRQLWRKKNVSFNFMLREETLACGRSSRTHSFFWLGCLPQICFCVCRLKLLLIFCTCISIVYFTLLFCAMLHMHAE